MTNASFIAASLCLAIGVILICSTNSCAWMQAHPQEVKAAEKAVEEGAEAAIKLETGIDVPIEALVESLENSANKPK